MRPGTAIKQRGAKRRWQKWPRRDRKKIGKGEVAMKLNWPKRDREMKKKRIL